MTNGSEHIPERTLFHFADEEGTPLTVEQVNASIAGARRIIFAGSPYEVTKAVQTENGIDMTVVRVRESTRRLAEYEVVQ